MKKHWVYDFETLINCFTAVYINSKTDEKMEFICWKNRNDFPAFISHLEKSREDKSYHISYNGLSFDAQIEQYCLNTKHTLLKKTGEQIADIIYRFAQTLIQKSNNNEFLPFPQWKIEIPQIDVFKLNHWDNRAKMSSLKYIQYSIDWKNILEMPIHHTTPIQTEEELDLVLSYCENDVLSTKEIFIKSKELIELRFNLSKEYNIDLLSASETRISKEIFLTFLEKETGIDKKEIKKLRTPRGVINIKDVILPQVEFKTPELRSVKKWFENLSVDFTKKDVSDEKKGPKYTVNYKGIPVDYGMGGIHGCIQAGRYKAPNGWTIMSADVASFYPNLAIKNGFYPAHLNREKFLNLYEWFFEERKKISKKDPRNYVYKIILNSTYGLSKEANSFLYDPLMMAQITVNGQLLLSMLFEEIIESIPEAILIMANTDGAEVMIPNDKKDQYFSICKKWESLTQLVLEFTEYSEIITRDVNNYIGIYKDTSLAPKCKGVFEWEDFDKKKISILHKNKSFLIIPKAVYAYFTKGIKPEDFLSQPNNSFLDYCGVVKAKSGWEIKEHFMKNGEHFINPLQKINRYYISKDGSKLVKTHNDGREIQVEAGKWKQRVLNNIEQMDKPNDIDTQYYLSEIYKIIHSVEKEVTQGYRQLEMF